eukprot:TRINITY_DN5959_c0_g1_i1.p3 TRINITY_DN5959_c0_g1~~TRINITY_DN5959_c0_g1_i1.p3  ORF type:complete len:246 (-),score=23.15 TRINITY_DN5959_c0_g1_i1:1224-1961(-)
MKKNHKKNQKDDSNKAITLEDFHKFPRTRHILDAGGSGVSRDDLVMDKAEIAKFTNADLIVEEKVDGSNLGISVDKDFNIIYQNRSKIITSASHTQWKGLDNWLKQTPGIWDILTSPDIILFGEWCYFVHSIYYDQLPAYFIAFDIYIKSEKKFLSRSELERIIEPTGVPIIRKISQGRFNEKELLAFLETNSEYRSDGKVEGVYLRVDDERYNLDRGKIVRPDFIQGIEDHWMTMELKKNQLKY